MSKSWADADDDDDDVGSFLTPLAPVAASEPQQQQPQQQQSQQQQQQKQQQQHTPASNKKEKRGALKASTTTFTEEHTNADEWTVVVGTKSPAAAAAAAAPAAPIPAKGNAWDQRKAALEAAEAERQASAPAVVLPPGSAVIGDDDNDDDDEEEDGGDGLLERRDVRNKPRNGKTVRTNIATFGSYAVRDAQFRIGAMPSGPGYYSPHSGSSNAGFNTGVSYSVGKKKRWELVREGEPLPSPAALGIVVPPTAVPLADLPAAQQPVVHVLNTDKPARAVRQEFNRVARERDQAANRAAAAAAAAAAPANGNAAAAAAPAAAAAAAPAGWAVVRSRKGDVVKPKREPGKKGVRRNDAAESDTGRRVAGGRTGAHPERRRRGDDDDDNDKGVRREQEHRAQVASTLPASDGQAVAYVDRGARPADTRDGEFSRHHDRREGPKATNARVINKDVSAGRF